MDSLNHLKTNYRPRYFNREGQRQDFDIQGKNVLKYIEGCFETCAKEFNVCSPALSTCSYSSSSQEQDQVPSESKDKEQPESDQTKCMKDVNNAFNTFTFLSSPDRKDTCSDENALEDAETSSKSRATSPDKDFDMISLGSPALLMEEISSEGTLHIEDEANEMDLQNRDVGESEKYHSTKEAKELSVEGANCSSSSKKETSKSLLSLDITSSITQRLHIEDEANEMDLQNRDVGESEKYHSTKEVKELSVEEANCSSSSKKEISKSLLSLGAITCSITQRLHIEDEANEMDLQNRDVGESEKYHSTKEVKELSVEEANCSSSSKKEISKSLVSLGAITCSITQRNAVNVESEDECEFLIEESFGMPSRSWISSFRKSPKPRKKSSKTVSSQQKQRTRQHDVKINNKRGSQKLVTLSPIKQTGMKSTNDTETTGDGSWNVSRSNETMSSVDYKSLLISSTIQERNPQGISSDDTSVEINNSDSNVGSLTEDHASLLKLNHTYLKSATSPSCPSISKKTGKQKKSKAKSSVEMQGKERQEGVTASLVSEDSWQSQDTNMYSEDPISALTPICSRGPTAQLSASTPAKSFKRQHSQIITSSGKTLQTPRNSVEGSSVIITRGKRRILDSEGSFQSGPGDELCNEVDENHRPKEIQRINSSGKKPYRKGRRALSITPASHSSGNASYQEDSSEHSLTEASMQQQKRHTHWLRHSCAPDVYMNNLSGPVNRTEIISEHDTSSNWDDLNSGESGDLAEDTYEVLSNTLNHKLVLPTNTPNLRRTKRIRIKPLEYWRGERVSYKTRPSGGFVISGIISPEQKDPRKPRKRKPAVELEDILDISTVSLKDPSQPAVVFDAESNQDILLECVRSGSSHLFSIDNEMLSIYKYLTTPSFSAGKMILKPLKEKGSQHSHTDTLVFHITHGKLLLTMYDQCYSLTVGDYFFIPPGNAYNIRNLLNKECVILFTQLKGSRPES